MNHSVRKAIRQYLFEPRVERMRSSRDRVGEAQRDRESRAIARDVARRMARAGA